MLRSRIDLTRSRPQARRAGRGGHRDWRQPLCSCSPRRRRSRDRDRLPRHLVGEGRSAPSPKRPAGAQMPELPPRFVGLSHPRSFSLPAHRVAESFRRQERRIGMCLRRRSRHSGDPRPRCRGSPLAMRSHVSLWSGSRLVFARRREPLYLSARRVSDCREKLYSSRFASEDFSDSRAMQADQLADVRQRRSGLLRSGEALARPFSASLHVPLVVELGALGIS